MEEQGGLALYLFVANNSVSLVDNLGLSVPSDIQATINFTWLSGSKFDAKLKGDYQGSGSSSSIYGYTKSYVEASVSSTDLGDCICNLSIDLLKWSAQSYGDRVWWNFATLWQQTGKIYKHEQQQFLMAQAIAKSYSSLLTPTKKCKKTTDSCCTDLVAKLRTKIRTDLLSVITKNGWDYASQVGNGVLSQSDLSAAIQKIQNSSFWSWPNPKDWQCEDIGASTVAP
jgi:hypothetical protein